MTNAERRDVDRPLTAGDVDVGAVQITEACMRQSSIDKARGRAACERVAAVKSTTASSNRDRRSCGSATKKVRVGAARVRAQGLRERDRRLVVPVLRLAQPRRTRVWDCETCGSSCMGGMMGSPLRTSENREVG